MKKCLLFSFYFVLVSLFLISCSSKDEELPNWGTFKVNNNSYAINEGLLNGYKATTSDKSNNYIFTFSNLGEKTTRTVKIAIHFPYNTDISGDYELYGSSKEIDAWNSSYSETTDKYVQTYNNLKIGTCTITKKNENEFKVEFEIVPENGTVIEGEFIGEVKLHVTEY